MPTFGERLKELRAKAELTQKQLADAAGLPEGSIRNYEQETRQPLWDVVFRLTSALGVSSEEFRACADQKAKAAASGKKTAKSKRQGS